MKQYLEKTTIDSKSGIGVQKDYDITREKYLKSYNIHSAKVVSLKDPYRSGNIGIQIVGVHEEGIMQRPQDVIWAPMIMPFGGGEDFGFFSMPPIGADVMVTFLDGDLKNPVILGAWQSRKFVLKMFDSPNELKSNLSGFSKVKAVGDLTPTNNFGTMPTNVPIITPLSDGIKHSTINERTEGIKGLSANALSLLNNFITGGTYTDSLATLVPQISGRTPGVAPGIKTAFADMMKGNAGEIPGLSDSTQAYNWDLDTQFGDSLTASTLALSIAATVPASSIYTKIAALTPQAIAMTVQNISQQTLANTAKANILESKSGAPGLISRGLGTLKTRLYSGAISTSISSTLNSVSDGQIASLISTNIDKTIAQAKSTVTSVDALTDTFDTILKHVELAGKVSSGKINRAKATFALQNNSIDYVLATQQKQQFIFGSQCPLPIRNQTPARGLYLLGENFTSDTLAEKKEELNSCYLSFDKQDDSNGQYITPEPLVYTWKSPEGSSIEIDDTGYRNVSGTGYKGIDNRGIRLSTKKGSIIHLIDENNYEGIFLRDKNNNFIWIDSQTNTIHLFSNNGVSEDMVGDKNTNCTNKREVMTGDDVKFVGKDKKEVVAGDTSFNCNQNLVENVTGTWSITVHGAVNIMAMTDANIVANNKVVIGGAVETIINSAHITAQGGRIDWNSA